MTTNKIIGMTAAVEIKAEAGENAGPPSFEVVAYTGGQLQLGGWDAPLVVDLSGMGFGNSLVANLDHDSSKRVGNVTSKMIDNGQLVLSGSASAATEAKREVIESAKNGFVWQASIEATADQVEFIDAGKKLSVNGQDFEGPTYVARKSTLKGFAFVSHGADDNTTVAIAASKSFDSEGEVTMDPKLKSWIEGMGFNAESLSDDEFESLKANFGGKASPKPKTISAANPFEERKIEAKRREDIREVADRMIEQRNSSYDEINTIEKMVSHAIDASMSVQDFRLELYESMVPMGRVISSGRADKKVNNRIVEAAICQAGRLPDIEDHFDDRTLQAAHDEFKGRIGLKDLIFLAAENNGYRRGYGNDITHEVLRAAFNKGNGRQIAASGFSTVDIDSITSNTANKFIMRGWNMVDQTPLRIAKIQNVRDFKTITTVSLTDSAIYEKVGSSGEIKHGTLSELTYTNKADTYARMLSITRQDIINDDLGALTEVPMKLGNGAMKKLNDIFWTEFLGLVGASFFAAGNSNINTGVATMTTGGLAATETIFMNQTNPDGTPLGIEPQIILVPTALRTAARTLMRSEKLIDGTATATQGDTNIWNGRFRVESSPYISNSSYTGNTSVGWWMLADPNEMPVIAIAALNGRVEPTVDTADADFNVLGIQMRGYSDIGVADQEYRGGVYADGGAS